MIARTLRLVPACIALAALLACGKGSEKSVREYTVRGRVVQLPDPAQPASELLIAHEAIDDFVNRAGEEVGMDPMTMGFPLAEEVSTEGLAVNEPVELTLRVDWESEKPVQLTRLRELPPDTQIVYRAARPGGKQ